MKSLTYGRDDLNPVLNRLSIDYSDALEVVKPIIAAVRAEGDGALREYTLKFDKQDISSFRLTHAEIEAACARVDGKTIQALKSAHANIVKTHKKQYGSIKKSWKCAVAKGVQVGERINPIGSVGCYVPGGRASYPSTVLMTVTPAKIAGVKRIVVVSPPPIGDVVIAAAKIAGADEIYAVGGAQAIAALAYGTESIKQVSKIVGPGNKYVTAAKLMVYGAVDIDMPAGPSEVLIIADESSNPGFIAADILAQAEHDPNAQCVLATNSEKLAKDVLIEVKVDARLSEKAAIVSQSLENFTIIRTKSVAESIEFANRYAPEHLEIQTRKPDAVAAKITNAGAIFIGPYSPVAAGDYASGGNHVLPTGGAAKYSSQLSIRDYLKSTSVQKITREGLKKLAPTITQLAEKEGLLEHKRSVEKRLS